MAHITLFLPSNTLLEVTGDQNVITQVVEALDGVIVGFKTYSKGSKAVWDINALKILLDDVNQPEHSVHLDGVPQFTSVDIRPPSEAAFERLFPVGWSNKFKFWKHK